MEKEKKQKKTIQISQFCYSKPSMNNLNTTNSIDAKVPEAILKPYPIKLRTIQPRDFYISLSAFHHVHIVLKNIIHLYSENGLQTYSKSTITQHRHELNSDGSTAIGRR